MNFLLQKLFKLIPVLVLSLVLSAVFLNTSYAADQNPGFFPLSNSSEYGDLPDPVGTSGTLGAQNLVDKIMQNVKYIIGVVAIALITFSGFRLVAEGMNEQTLTDQKTALLYGVGGLALLGIALPLSDILSFQDGGPFSDSYEISERVKIFKAQTAIIITFIRYILGAIAVLFIVISGSQLIVAIQDEGALDNTKKRLLASVIGLLIVMMSGNLIDNILYKVDLNDAAQQSGLSPGIDPQGAIAEIIAITNLLVTFIGPLLVIVFIGAGIYYVTSFQDESRMETAKKWMMNAVIGLIIVYGAFAIVSTFIAGNIDGV